MGTQPRPVGSSFWKLACKIATRRRSLALSAGHSCDDGSVAADDEAPAAVPRAEAGDRPERWVTGDVTAQPVA
eukprot:scaffold3767_cov114-Isochrysis_galbana.AAC.42